MIFEEQFPSLCEKENGYFKIVASNVEWKPIPEDIVGLDIDANFRMLSVELKDIMEYCLDKQRVKDAIEKVQWDESGKGDYQLTVALLKKELGL